MKRLWGPTSFRLSYLINSNDEGGEERWYVVGGYLRPSDKEEGAQRRVLQAPTKPLISINLNANLEVAWTR